MMTQIFFTCKKCGTEFIQEDHNDSAADGMSVAYFSHCPKCGALCEVNIENKPAPITPHKAAAKIIAHYGVPHQLVKLCEECGELIQQAAKCYESGTSYNSDFVEELADVRVMLLQFEAVLGRSAYWSDLYTGMISAKLGRQIKRIENELETRKDG